MVRCLLLPSVLLFLIHMIQYAVNHVQTECKKLADVAILSISATYSCTSMQTWHHHKTVTIKMLHSLLFEEFVTVNVQ